MSTYQFQIQFSLEIVNTINVEDGEEEAWKWNRIWVLDFILPTWLGLVFFFSFRIWSWSNVLGYWLHNKTPTLQDQIVKNS